MTTTSNVRLICLPGFDGTGELFEPLLSELGRGITPTMVRYSTERSFADYVDSVARALPEQGAVLVAESFSGPIALAVMARHPSRVHRAILCATFAESPFRWLARAARHLPESLFASTHLQRTAVLRYFCLNGASELIEPAERVLRSVDRATLRRRLSVLADLDVRPLLAQIAVPILYLRARQDRIVSSALSAALINALPHATVRDIDGPHLLLQSRPSQCAVAIADFLTEPHSKNANVAPVEIGDSRVRDS